MNIEEVTSAGEGLKQWLAEYKSSSDPKIKSQLRNLIVIAYLPFVKKISHGLARRSTDPIEDLVQVGSMGLLKAIDQYNTGMGASFKTYATYLITGEIRHYLRDKITMIRAPRELHELSFRINQIVQKLTTKLDRSPSDLEIADELQISVSRVTEIIEIDRRKQMLSLDQVVSGANDSEQTLVDKLIDSKYQDHINIQEEKIMLMEAIESLNKDLKKIIDMSFFQDLNQMEIAKQLGISQMQVSRRLKKATTELFNIITSKKAAKTKQESK